MKIYQLYIKSLLDFLISVTIFSILLPVFLCIMLLLAFTNNGKPFFRQPRPGKGGRIFKVIKFKTMNDKRNLNGEVLPDEMRLTALGKFIRKTSLDEIPQLLNVIRGEMSLIGPRPLLVEYLPLYNEDQNKRHLVRPGISGWAQVNGRNTIGWEKKFAYDIWYVEHISFLLDVKILLLTIIKVFRSEGISAQGVVTMPKFEGENKKHRTNYSQP